MPIFPVHYGGSIGYYQHLLQVHAITFEVYEHFVKQTHRNRLEIIGPNGRQILVIPTKKSVKRRITGTVEISYDEPWQKEHWKSLEAAYRRSPFFEFYEDEFRNLYLTQTQFLVDFNMQLMSIIDRLLDLNLKHTKTKQYDTEDAIDYRSFEFPLLSTTEYIQVFGDRHPFEQNLSILDALFNVGPRTKEILVVNK